MITDMEEQPREEEVVDGYPVLATDVRVIEPVPAGAVPARQAAAIAATTFVAGAATAAMVSRRRSAKPSRKRRKSSRGKSAIGEIVGSNSFLVDVHLLRRD